MHPTPSDLMQHLTAKIPLYSRWRQHLHQHPELAFKENKTADYLLDFLKEKKVTIHSRLAETGIIASLQKGKSQQSIGIRADMDALPINEQNALEYGSRHVGCMHACGHDGHMAMLMAAIDYLVEYGDFDGRVYFIFQPAEEIEGGGQVMVDQGLFADHPMDSVYAMHNWPGLEAGQIAVREGPVMAAFDLFDIVVKGKGGHAAKPHLTKDPVIAAAQLVMSLQSVCSRENDPLQALVLSITQIQGGENYNVIPAHVSLKGTVRTFDPAVQQLAIESMQRIINGVAVAFDVDIQFNYQKKYPATINHAQATRIIQQVAENLFGADKIITDKPPSMGSEDFSFMLNACPGSYVWIGNGDSNGLHHPGYDFNDQIIPNGAALWISLVETSLPSV